MVEADRALADRPSELARANKRFHRQMHRASHNRYLNRMLQDMRRSLALLSSTSLAVPGRGVESIAEHDTLIRAVEKFERTLETDKFHFNRSFRGAPSFP